MSAFAKIEVANAYRGTIVDAVAGKTKNGYPQAILRLKAEEAANEKGEFETLDASAQITTYLVLFNSNEVYNEQTVNLNYPQLKKIGGWEDAKFSFAEIAKLTGKKAFFRTEEKEYNGKTNMQVVWIDEYDSDGTTTLRGASEGELQALDSLLKFAGAQGGLPGSPAPKRGRPAKKAEPVDAPLAQTNSVPVTAAAPSAAVQVNTPAPVGAKTPPPDEAVTTAPAECTKMQAWEYVNEQCKNHGDEAIGNAWLASIKKLGGDPKQYTPAQWAAVRDGVVGSLIPF